MAMEHLCVFQIGKLKQQQILLFLSCKAYFVRTHQITFRLKGREKKIVNQIAFVAKRLKSAQCVICFTNWLTTTLVSFWRHHPPAKFTADLTASNSSSPWIVLAVQKENDDLQFFSIIQDRTLDQNTNWGYLKKNSEMFINVPFKNVSISWFQWLLVTNPPTETSLLQPPSLVVGSSPGQWWHSSVWKPWVSHQASEHGMALAGEICRSTCIVNDKNARCSSLGCWFFLENVYDMYVW